MASGSESNPTIPAKSRNVAQLAVTLLCVVGCGLLLVWNQQSGSSTALAPSFTKIVNDALASKETSRSLIQRLQYAQATLVRGDRETARTWFGGLRDDLLRREERITRENKVVEMEILRFVEDRLGELK